MSYWWQQASFPVTAGEEVTWKHFEDLRKAIWLRDHLGACIDPTDYTSANASAFSNDGRGSTTSWAAFCASLPTSPSPFPLEIGHQYLQELIYLGPGETEGDKYTNYVAFNNLAELTNHPPVDGSGNWDAEYWRKNPDYNYYHDWDYNSGRYNVIRNTAAAAPEEIDLPAYRWLPKQTDLKTQLNKVKYTDTGRIIKRQRPLEYNRRYLSQPYAMGAKFDLECERIGGNIHYAKYQTGVDIGMAGVQYTCGGAQPGNKTDSSSSDASPAYQQGDYQYLYDPSVCDAYQNIVEVLACSGNWSLPIVEDTDWGDEFIANYNAKRLLNYEAYDSEAVYDPGDNVQYDGYIWYYEGGYGTNDGAPGTGSWSKRTEPAYPAPWGTGYVYPVSAYLEDENWGCNGSAFELLLWVIGEYDWYYDTEHPFIPLELLKLRLEASEGASPPSQSEIDTAYPLPAGTWRRTWRYSFGRPRSAQMRPESYGTMERIVYADEQTATANIPDPIAIWWPGPLLMDSPDAESTDLTSGQQAEIAVRHETILADELYYELEAGMVNDLWDVLEQMVYRNAGGLSAVMRFEAGLATSATEKAPHTQAAELAAAAEAALASASPGGYYPCGWWGYLIDADSDSLYTGQCRYDLPSIELTVNSVQGGLFFAGDVICRILWYQYVVSECDYAQHYTKEITVGFSDNSQLTVDTLVSDDPGNIVFNVHWVGLGPPEEFDNQATIELPISILSTAPAVPSDEDAATVGYFSRVDFFPTIASNYDNEDAVLLMIDYDNVPAEVFSTERHVVFSAVAVDDEAFDSDGNLV